MRNLTRAGGLPHRRCSARILPVVAKETQGPWRMRFLPENIGGIAAGYACTVLLAVAKPANPKNGRASGQVAGCLGGWEAGWLAGWAYSVTHCPIDGYLHHSMLVQATARALTFNNVVFSPRPLRLQQTHLIGTRPTARALTFNNVGGWVGCLVSGWVTRLDLASRSNIEI